MHIMLADYSTKLTQMGFFHNPRDIIMGRVTPYTLLEKKSHIQAMSALEKYSIKRDSIENGRSIEKEGYT